LLAAELAPAGPELTLIELRGGTRYLATELDQSGRLLVFTTEDGQRFSVRRDQVTRVASWQRPTPTPTPLPRPAVTSSETRRPRRTAGTLSVLGSGEGDDDEAGAEPAVASAGPESAESAESAEPATPPAREHDEAYWRQRASEQLERLEFLERKVAELEALKAGFGGLATAQVREGYEPLRTSDLMSIELRLQPLKRQLERNRAEWRRFKQEARQSGALPGWLRPPREPTGTAP
jgi:hypothetical protein